MHTGPNASSHDIEICRRNSWQRSGTSERCLQGTERYSWFYRTLYLTLQHKRLALISFVTLTTLLASRISNTPQSFSAFVTIEGATAQEDSPLEVLSTPVIQAVWSYLPMRSLLNAYLSNVEKPTLLTDEFQKKYRDLFRIEPQVKQNQVQLRVTTEDPILSKFLASVHSQAFVTLLRKERTTSVLRQLDDVEDELAQIIAQISNLDSQYQQLAPPLGEDDVIKDDTYLTGLLSALTAATAERIKAEAAWVEATQGKGLSVQDVRELTSREAESLLTAKQA